MRQTKTSDTESLSRRKMLAVTGSALVIGVTNGPCLSAGEPSSEIRKWSQLVGNRFAFQFVDNSTKEGSGRPARVRLLLMEVTTPSWDDPDRPEAFRQPFTLVFRNEVNRSRFQSGNYRWSSSRRNEDDIFLNLAMDYGRGEMVIEAIFN